MEMRSWINDFYRAHLFAVSTSVPAVIAAVLWMIFVDPFNQDSKFYDAVSVIAAGALAWLLSALTIYQLSWRILRFVRTRRGADIKNGATVRILCGTYKNTITQVYETWDERGQARVDLGAEAKNAVKDVYMNYQLERAELGEQ